MSVAAAATKYHLPDGDHSPRSSIRAEPDEFSTPHLQPQQPKTPLTPFVNSPGMIEMSQSNLGGLGSGVIDSGDHECGVTTTSTTVASYLKHPLATKGSNHHEEEGLLSIPERDNLSHADVSQATNRRPPVYQTTPAQIGNGHTTLNMKRSTSPVSDDHSPESSENKDPALHGTTRPSTLMRRTSTMLQAPTLLAREDLENHGQTEAPPGFFKPNTKYLLWWSYFIMALSIYNTVTIPYRWAFWDRGSIPIGADVVVLLVIDTIGDICFFIEMYLNIRTGYVDNGVIIYDQKKIWKKYLKSWFWLDVITCIPFDFIQLNGMVIMPAVRAAKILRIFQVLHHYNHIEENTTVSLQFRVGKLLFYTGVLSHFTACVKYKIILEDHATNPIQIELLTKDPFGRYLQSMYWATGAVIGRDDTNAPENLQDCGFTVVMMFVGILWLAYIIASLETFAHDGNNTSARFQAKVGYVTKFMHQFQLPEHIQDKVKAYYSYLWSSSLRYETEHFLRTLPVTLQADVNLSMHRVIERAEIFQDVDSGFLAYIVQALTTTVSIPGEIICHVDLAGLEMWFIAEGEVEICIGPKLAAIAKLREGDYFGEYAILGQSKVRTATARSVSYCTLLVLSAANLTKALALFPNSDLVVRGHVDEHRSKTILQERNFLGLDSAQPTLGGKKHKGNDKLKKLITVDEQVKNKEAEVWTISPISKFYTRWQAVYFFVMAWNAIVLPIRFGFLPTDVDPTIMTIDYLGDLFLIADIILNFRLRFVQGGAEISDPKLIRDRYLSGWFVPHVLSSIPLDFVMISVGMQPLYRLNRILRLAHVHKEILAKLKDQTYYEILSLIYLVFNFLFISHWASCIYFAMTRINNEGFQADYPDGTPDYDGWRPSSIHNHGTLIYQYLQSQYYAMALLAGIGRHLYPPSNYDVMLSLFVMLTGVFVVSYLIGKVGHLIFNLNASAAEFKAEQAFVNQLLDYRKVSNEVTARVTEYMRHIWSSQKGIDPNVALRGLPHQIRTDIMMHICEEMIRKVPRFKDLDDNFVRQLVSELSFVELPAGEYVFRQGQIGDCMYFISKGLVEILFDAPKVNNDRDDASPRVSGGGSNTPASPHQLKIIGQGSFFGEGALFSGTRAASIRARTPVKLLSLTESSFQKVMHVHPHFAEKIMFLNAERQRKLEEKATTIKEGDPAVLSAPGGVPAHRKLNSAHISPRPSALQIPEASSPRRPSVGRSRFRSVAMGQTGLASKVELLLRQEKEKEESRRSGSTPGKPGSIINTAAPTGTVSAMASVGTATTPAIASAAATTTSSHPVPGGQWNAGINGAPPTLTITTTHTIALHDHGHGVSSSASLGGHDGHGSTHIISDIEINRPNATTTAASRPSPDVSPADHERILHSGGMPPGYSMDDESLASLPQVSPPSNSPKRVVSTDPQLINPSRSSLNAKNPPIGSSASSSSSQIRPTRPHPAYNFTPQPESHSGEVGGVPYPSSNPFDDDVGGVGFPRDSAADNITAAPADASEELLSPSQTAAGIIATTPPLVSSPSTVTAVVLAANSSPTAAASSSATTPSLGGIGTKSNRPGRQSAGRLQPGNAKRL